MALSSAEYVTRTKDFLAVGAYGAGEMERIGARRPLAKGLSQQQLADRLNTDNGLISRYENNKREMTLNAANEFACALGIETLAIFRDPNTPSVDELLAKATPEKRKEAVAIVQALLKAS
jgi:transcriptional regulator with XRE-family HTH domain